MLLRRWVMLSKPLCAATGCSKGSGWRAGAAPGWRTDRQREGFRQSTTKALRGAPLSFCGGCLR